jgi:hypothetical protein
VADLAIALQFTGSDAGASAAATKVSDAVTRVGDSADVATKRSGGLASALGGIASVAGGFVLAQGLMQLPGLLTDAAKAAAEEETGIKRLAQAVNNAGGSWDAQSGAIEGVISQREKLGFADDKLRSSLAMLTAQTGSVDEAFKRQSLAMDLSRGANIDLETASKLLGKVTEDNVNVLSRYGVSVEKGASQTELFAAIQQKFGGQAEATAKSAAVQWEIFQNQLGNLKEDIGSALLPVMTQLGGAAIAFVDELRESGALTSIVEGLTSTFSTFGNVATATFDVIKAATSTDLFGSLMDAAGTMASGIQTTFELMASTVSAVVAGDIPVAIQTLEDALNLDLSGLTGSVGFAQNELTILQGHFDAAVQFITGTIMPTLQAGIQTALDAITAFWQVHGETIMATVQSTWTGIQAAVETVLNVVVPFAIAQFQMVSDWVQANWPLIEQTIGTVLNGIAALVQAVVPPIVQLITDNWTTIQTVTEAIWTIVTTLINTNLQVMMGFMKTTMQIINGDWSGAWETIQSIADIAFRGVIRIIETVGALVLAAKTAVWNALLDAARTAWDALVALVSAKMEEARVAVVTTIGGWAQTGADIGASLMKGITDLIGGAIPGMVKQLTDAAGQALEGVRGLFGSGAVGGGRGGGTLAGFDIDAIAAREGISGALFRSLIEQESSGNMNARSSAGAIGFSQLMPGTARGLGVDPFDPEQNLIGGARYLKQMIDMFGGNIERALIAYNAGPGGGAPGESRAYAQRVIAGAGTQRGDSGVQQVSQFGIGLSPGEAQAACGPAALNWFMNLTGRNPTGAEARNLAQQFGWDASRGMYGPNAFAGAAATIGATSADFTPTRGEVDALAQAGTPFALSTAGHYFQVSGGNADALTVGASGTALRGGKPIMSLSEITALSGPMNGLIALTGDLNIQVANVGTTSTESFTEMGSAVAEVDPKLAALTAAQERVNAVIGQGFPQATGQGTAELQAFGAGAQILTDQLLAQQIGVDDAALGLVRYAASTGLAIAPMQQMEAGLINQDQALQMVLSAASAVNPAYINISAGFQSGATSATQTTLDFLQLAASTKGVTDAVIPADQALKTLAASMPDVATLAVEGALTGDELTRSLLGLVEASGFARSGLDLTSASGAEMNTRLAEIVDTMAIADPRFRGLSDTIHAQGGITAATTGDLVNLLNTVDDVPGVVDAAATATANFGSAQTEAAGASRDAWQEILKEIRDSVKEMTQAIKSGVREIVSALNQISDTKVRVDTRSAVKSIDELSDEARSAIGWLEKLERESGQRVRFSGGPSGRHSGGWADEGTVGWVGERGPELSVSRGDYVLTHAEAMNIARTAFGQSGVPASSVPSGPGGGRTVVINANFHNHGTIVGQDDIDDWVLGSIKDLAREGRLDGVV